MDSTRRLAVLAALTAICFVAGRLGLLLAFSYESASPVSPVTGIALVAFLVLGPRAWVAVFVGALLVHLSTTGLLAPSVGIALGRTLEGALAVWVVHRWVGGREAFGRPRRILRFAGLVAGLTTVVSATMGVGSLVVGGFAQPGDLGPIWLTWWLGGAVGNLVVAPAMLLWIADPLPGWRTRKTLEAAAVLLSLVAASQFVFGPLSPAAVRRYPLEFLCIPSLLWAAFRFGPRETATAVLLLSGMAISGTLDGLGPFVRETPDSSLLLLQAFTAVVAVMGLVVAALVAERRHVEGQLRDLVVSDPLTGLGNYRRLVTVLETEIERSGRTGRPFALLFLDLDDLKGVNDRHGHIVGSRALVRLAEVLVGTCRAVDTAARYGGDEFAVVLPETDEAAAREVARRVADRLAEDRERPTLTASLGVAVFPRDGETAEALIGSADRTLYEMKARLYPARES